MVLDNGNRIDGNVVLMGMINVTDGNIKNSSRSWYHQEEDIRSCQIWMLKKQLNSTQVGNLTRIEFI